MAKKAKATGKTGASKKQKNAPKTGPREIMTRLDKGGKDYAKLIADPCYGKLTMPLFDGAGTGNLVRVESDFILGAEATSVGAAVIFTPGLLGLPGAAASVTIPTTVVNSDSAAIVWQNSIFQQPGYGLSGIAGAVRAVSACIQVSYIGSENSRAGIVSLHQSTLASALTYTSLATARGAADRVVKMPDGTLELKLRPGATSSGFSPVLGALQDDRDGLPCLVATVSGIPGGTGCRFRLVVVYEWIPKVSSGVMTNSMVADSMNSLQMVLNVLDKAKPGWQYDLMTGLGAYAAKSITFL